MSDLKKTQEISKKIQEIARSVQSHETNIRRIESEKNDKTRYFDQQIAKERDEIKRLNKQIEDLKRQLLIAAWPDHILALASNHRSDHSG